MPGKVTVVTPVLNGARFLEATIASVQAQTHDDWEYIIADGGSSDDSLAIAQKFASQDGRIRVMARADRGIYDAVLNGFRAGSGDYCCWINSDDLLLPWAFECAAWLLSRPTVDWVIGNPCYFTADSGVPSLGPFRVFPRSLIERGLFHGRGLGWIQQESVFFSRQLLESVGPAALEYIATRSLAGDFLLWTEFAQTASPLCVPVPLGGFRRHGENLSRLRTQEYYQEIREAGFWIPSVVSGRIIRSAVRPVLSFLSSRSRARWLAAWPHGSGRD